MNAKLRWSANHPLVDVPPEQLASCLDDLATKCENVGIPFIVDVMVHGHEMLLVGGLPGGFVRIKSQTGKPPYCITLGNPAAKGVVSFTPLGAHATEIPRRNLIST